MKYISHGVIFEGEGDTAMKKSVLFLLIAAFAVSLSLASCKTSDDMMMEEDTMMEDGMMEDKEES